ncbi:MAG: DNA polymerase III subunit alpha [Candidatus Neomarinimicrobiota bacterium]
MRGLLPVNQLIQLSKSNGMESLALTDINCLSGFINFVKHCNSMNVNPIAGVNLITKNEDIVVLVENQIGYENLCRIISKSYDMKDQKISDIIASHFSGLFILTEKYSILKQLNSVVSDTHLFVELRPGGSESEARKLAKKLKLEVVATGNVYFHNMNDYESYLILQAIKKNTKIDNIKKENDGSALNWFRNEESMARLFPNSLDAINNSFYLANRCKKDWSFVNTIFPGLALKDTYRANDLLKKKVYLGAKKRYSNVNHNIKSRIEHEFNLITQKGFATYFLIVADIVSQTKSTIGRGSGAASIVSYCLFITQVDPIKYGLKFERFIHPERKKMPDIDIDFPWDERDSILEYVFAKYSKGRTAMVANQVFIRSKSAVREVGKVYGLSSEEIKSLTSRIRWYNKKSNLYQMITTNSNFDKNQLADMISKILKKSRSITGVFRHFSVHPGGVIIVPDEIQKYVPILQTPKGVQIVEWDKDQVEDSGLLKIDLLGNRSLAVVRDTLKQINIDKRYKSNFDYHQIQPVNDKKTEALLKKGKTMGVFYIESPSVRQLLAKSRLVDFDHIVIYSSIIRPAANRYINLMLSRIHGEKWSLIHPDLDFLNETYGIMVYEEQVAMAIMKMTDLGYNDTKLLQKAVSKNRLLEISAWKDRFIKKSLTKGYKIDVANTVWNMISSFIGFSFCKPHSASYAMLAMTCAYLKTHFTAKFIASVISNQGGYYSSYAYMSEAKRFGIKILYPDINESYYEWRGYDKMIRMGFMSIKNLRKTAISVILKERKQSYFKSLNDFINRVQINLADAMAITNARCFDKLCPDLHHREIAYLVAGFYTGKNNFFSVKDINCQLLTKEETYLLELDSFGYPISSHPVAKYRSRLSQKIIFAKDISKYDKKLVYLLGIYIARKESLTRKSEPMEFLTLEDETDTYECILFPDVFKQFSDLVHWENLFIVKGKVDKSFGFHNIIIEKMASAEQWINRLENKKNEIKYVI